MAVTDALMQNTTQLSLISFLALAAAGLFPARAQQAAGGKDLVERGKYIVESVAMCERCHTPRDDKGNADRTHWLMGGPVQIRPSYSDPSWALVAPRLAGAPPGTDAEFITLLTTGISRTGSPPKLPMPPFRMSRADAQAVLAYLKSFPR
jgi:mono/diheme cytochrome c family protein